MLLLVKMLGTDDSLKLCLVRLLSSLPLLFDLLRRLGVRELSDRHKLLVDLA